MCEGISHPTASAALLQGISHPTSFSQDPPSQDPPLSEVPCPHALRCPPLRRGARRGPTPPPSRRRAERRQRPSGAPATAAPNPSGLGAPVLRPWALPTRLVGQGFRWRPRLRRQLARRLRQTAHRRHARRTDHIAAAATARLLGLLCAGLPAAPELGGLYWHDNGAYGDCLRRVHPA